MNTSGETVVLMFTDIEGSTRLIRELGRDYEDLLVQHHEIIQGAASANDGELFGSEGDGLALMFPTATKAIKAALQAQRELSGRPWPGGKQVKVRMGIHAGEVVKTSVSYVGVALHEVARLMAVGHGGQVLVSETAALIARADLPPGVTLRLLGRYRLRDYVEPARIHQLHAPDLVAHFPPLRTPSDAADLPLRSTSFVGRDSELEVLKTAIGRSRLVSLVGAGGSGKTRLALELADRVTDRFPGGVAFAQLTGVTDPEQVEQAVASAVLSGEAYAGAERSGRSDPDVPQEPVVQRLTRHFERDAGLLIVDNCEHVLDASADFVWRLTSATTNVTVVATSRERLHIDGETVFPLLPLAVPADDGRSIADLSSTPAVELLVDRARALDPRFEITEQHAPAIARLCRRLDGIPLAIEIAAGQLQFRSVQYVERLSTHLRLVSETRSSDPRHQTMYATLDWSHDLLEPSAQALLRRLSVFAGGFTLEAAEHVCSEVRSELESSEIASLIGELVTKSMVLFDPGLGDGRYRLLEPVRQYAADKLGTEDEVATLRDRHAQWIVRWSREVGRGVAAGNPETGELRVEHDNLEHALQWADESGDHETLLRIVGSLGYYWMATDGVMGQRWAERALAHGEDAPPSLRAPVLLSAGQLLSQGRDQEDAVRFLQEALTMSISLRRPRLEAWTRYFLGRSLAASHPEAAKEHVSRAFDFFEDRDAFGAAWCLQWLATAAENAGDAERAEELWRSSIGLARKAGAHAVVGNALSELAVRAQWRGEDERARTRAHEAVDVQRSHGDRWNLVNILLTAGRIDASTGHLDVARAEIHEAFVLTRAIRARNWQAPILLLTLTKLLAEEGDLARAAELLLAVEAYLGGEFPDRRYQRVHQEVRSRLGGTESTDDPLPIDEAMSRAFSTLEGRSSAAGAGAGVAPQPKAAVLGRAGET